MRPIGRIPLLALAAAAGAFTFAAASAQPPSPSTPAPHQVLTGTVYRVDSQGGTIDLLTAVGHAFRVHRLRLAAGLVVRGRGAGAGVSALVPGAVCRVECQVAGAVMTASTVELLQPAEPTP